MAGVDEPIVVNGTRLKNRLVLAPITTNYAAPEGAVTDEVLRFYEQRVRDVGLVVVEATAVRPDGRLVPNSLGLWEERLVPGLARLARAIHAQGAAAVVQLNHAGARGVPIEGPLLGASPSGIAFRPDVAPFAMSETHFRQLADAFAAAAARAVAAGFDGVEIHGAHFYLLSQFLSPLTNLREDRYGGDAAGRATFPVEVARAVRNRLGESALLLFRLNGEERVDGGQCVEDAVTAGRALVASGVDALDVSLVANGSWAVDDGRRYLVASSALSKEELPGTAVPLAARVRRETGVPVIAVGKLGSPEAAAAGLAEGADLVAIGRQLIADPDAAGKILSGRGAEIVPCTECFRCFATIRRGQPMECPVLG
ncbi:MAG: NADH:flavin oxidoreductase [Deltaproteobacteria bacterium]|nr:NADH:flavin oxidoreductase [Deltaproteobacteria bacterium]